jgi:hypothetical protein
MAKPPVEVFWTFSQPFAKRWSDKFSNEAIPREHAYLEDLIKSSGLSSEDGGEDQLGAGPSGVRLFLQPYEEDISYSDLKPVLKFCTGCTVQNLQKQSKQGSAWMDDRTYASHRPHSALTIEPRPTAGAESSSPDTQLRDESISLRMISEHGRHASDGSSPLMKSDPLNNGRTGSGRYMPRSRLYPAPLNAAELYYHLKIEVQIFWLSFLTGFCCCFGRPRMLCVVH